ncbi:MAG TPA: nuclear transport factor 2 family protein, partial [Vicinamibacterales bacterium]|nr:nuclear transport factor 2 family protein [Vicinamibacterales bacterium]
DSTDFLTFEPQEFVAQGDRVVVIGRYSAKMKPSGHQYASGWVMLFTVKNGKIAKFAEYSDSAQLIRAYTGATVGA